MLDSKGERASKSKKEQEIEREKNGETKKNVIYNAVLCNDIDLQGVKMREREKNIFIYNTST